MSAVAWDNARSAMPACEFLNDLARGTTNSGEIDAGSTWFLNFVSDYLRSRGLSDGPWAAFDFAIFDLEALAGIWPIVTRSLASYADQRIDARSDVAASLARFLVERMPAQWDGPSWTPHVPLTAILVIADRIDTMVGLFLIGKRPNGSKDPYALRRAAKHFLHQVMFPFTRIADAA